MAKNMVMAFAAILGLGMVMSSCNNEYDDIYPRLPEEKEVKPDTTKVEPKDTTKVEPEDKTPVLPWLSEIDNTFYVDDSRQATSTKVIVDSLGNHYDRVLSYILGIRIEAPKKVYTSVKDSTAYRYAGSPESSYGDYHRTEGGDSARLVTTQKEFFTNVYSLHLTTTREEGYTILNGQRSVFMNKSESSVYSYKTSKHREEVSNDSIYDVETCLVFVAVKLHNKTFQTSATTEVWRFLKMKEKEQPDEPNVGPDPDPEPQTTETMPDADLTVDKIVKVNDITFSPEFLGGNSVKWHKVCLVESANKFHFYVDGTFVGSEDIPNGGHNGNFNSAYYAEGAWHAALLKEDGHNGWTYTFYVNGSGKVKNVDQNMALTSGLKNFKKSSNAAQTPAVYTTTESKQYNGKTWMKVSGWNIDNKAIIVFTIREQ